MSFILDALRRAEAERQRGAVPGLHAQPAHSGAPAPRSRRLDATVAAGALVLIGAAATAWWLGRSGGSPPVAATSAAPPAAIAPVAAPAQAPASLAVAPAPAPTPLATPAPPPPQVVVLVTPAPAPPQAPPAPIAAAASAPPARLPTWAELPESTRAALPGLTLGGIVHASAPSQRLVILGGQVFHEGDRPLPELLVQEIRPRTVVLNWRGQGFELGP